MAKVKANEVRSGTAVAVVIASTEPYRHTIMRNLEIAYKNGNFDQGAILKRTARAVKVLRDYVISDHGFKINGWAENVKTYALRSPAGRNYEVQLRKNGQTSCDCPDWKFRRKSHAGFCKHSLAISALNA